MGNPDDTRFRLLTAILTQQKMPGSSSPHFTINSQEYVVSVTQARQNVWVLRAAAHCRMALQPLGKAILAVLADEDLLGYHPLARKH
ncbi:hypothetical protein [Hymenobacter sp. UYCo722]|uniref:hypothetical protein n=1 Tax=Hymenobacter sp. UYCo722 TaxID=3156335 RepID=UPI0033961F47